ncbi:MAG: zinc ABC transporter substrate-binding protein, partial [Tenericutes bacterium]|nr:zinc ABC transporter substrate-binding protein [Mycoplasmatota bacterium]
MKKILIIIISCALLSACTLTDDFSDKYLYTTMYPIEYATTMIYSDYAKISSVYPNDATLNYEVTNKKKTGYAEKGEMFIYSGVANEAYLAKDLLNINGKMKLIDATKGMNNDKGFESVWLDPSNYLMLCSNIKSSLIDYNDNVYIKEAIEDNYKILNEKVSELDVQLYNIGKNGNYNTLLVADNVFTYLTKYNINVISIDSNNQSIDKSYSDAKKLIENGNIKYIYYINDSKLTQTQEKFISDYSLTKVRINDLFTLTDNERKENKNYITLMN